MCHGVTSIYIGPYLFYFMTIFSYFNIVPILNNFCFIFFSFRPTNFHTHKTMNSDDLDWEPPSEADMKLIQARRERSDQISKLMSTYLLKGYKMLGSVCSKCDVGL